MSTASIKLFDSRDEAQSRVDNLMGWDDPVIVPYPDDKIGGYYIQAIDPSDNQRKSLRTDGFIN